MAAASRYAPNSPTAQLLRSSRLFSVPKPLPRPQPRESFKSKVYNDSPTGTTPYPTHQIIATTHAARARGDWGLKRPLPAKTTSKAQSIRVREMDTYDQIVEFEHAQDHAVTLQKLQNLNLAITRPDAQGSHYAVRAYHDPSAFEPQFDNTTLKPVIDPAEKTVSRDSNLSTRWRRRGPELDGMSEAEFEEYRAKVKGQSREFMKSLQWRAIREYVGAYKEEAAEAGSDEAKLLSTWLSQLSPTKLYAFVKEHTPAWLIEGSRELEQELRTKEEDKTVKVEDFAKDWLEVQLTAKTKAGVMQDLPAEIQRFPVALEKYWTQYWINFRNKSGDDSSSRQIIEEFLDMAPTAPGSEFEATHGNINLSTHPSAGLSYRRSNQVVNNDPVLGPLLLDTPNKARYLPMPAAKQTTYLARATDYSIGLAGVVVSRERIVGGSPTGLTDERTPRGGQKVMLNVLKTEILPSGKINLQARESGDVEKGISQGKLQKAMTEDAELKEMRDQIESTPQVNPSTLPIDHGAPSKEPGNIEIEL